MPGSNMPSHMVKVRTRDGISG